MPSLTFTLLMDPPGEEQCSCRLANLQNTLPFSLLRAADRYAYTLWKHCLFAIYLGRELILIDIRKTLSAECPSRAI
jgi:hypothetical protein